MKGFRKIFIMTIMSLLFIVSAICLTACGGVNNFKISFMVDNEVYAIIETTGNEAISIPNNPVKDGFTFDEWFWDDGVWQKPFTANSLLDAPISSDMKVYAKFSEEHTHNYTATVVEPTYTEQGYTIYTCSCGDNYKDNYVDKLVSGITFKTLTLNNDNTVYDKVANGTNTFSFLNEITVNGSATYTVSTDIYGQQVIPSKTVQLNAIDNTFYILADNTDSGLVLYTVTIRVRQMYSVTFDTLGGSEINSQIIEEDSFATIPQAPTKTGYTFMGYDYDITNSPVIENTVISAIWQANTYTVSFDGNGEENPQAITVTYDSPYGLPNITKTGYTLGWYTALSGGTEIKSTDIVDITDNITLYARWSINNYNVNLIKSISGAGAVSGGGNYTFDTQRTITATIDTGYTWLGWYNGDTLLTNELSYTFNVPGEDVTYIAKWVYYTLTTNRNMSLAGCGYQSYKDCKISVGESVTIRERANTGYTFIGWYNGDTLLTKELSYTFNMPSESVTYTAKYMAYTLTTLKNIDKGTITEYNEDKVVAGTRTVLYASCTYLGYEFLGWYNGDMLLTNESSYSFDMPSESVTYTAKYQLKSEMSNFNFSSTANTCSIMGINDKTVTEIIVPDYVTSISQGAFSGCSNLENITLPFVGGSKKTTTDTYQYPLGYIFGENNYLGGTAILQRYFGYSTTTAVLTTYYVPTSLQTVTISGGNILYGAFYDCSSLVRVNLQNGVTSIDTNAFYDCSSLTSITIPSSVTSIGKYALCYCYKLTSVTFEDTTTWYSTSNSNYTGGEVIDVTNSLNNATLFTSTNPAYYWYKV